MRFWDERGAPPPVIDAADFLHAPEAHLRWLCDWLGIAFTDRMLSWPAGPRDSDGVWAPHWYDAVLALDRVRAVPTRRGRALPRRTRPSRTPPSGVRDAARGSPGPRPVADLTRASGRAVTVPPCRPRSPPAAASPGSCALAAALVAFGVAPAHAAAALLALDAGRRDGAHRAAAGPREERRPARHARRAARHDHGLGLADRRAAVQRPVVGPTLHVRPATRSTWPSSTPLRRTRTSTSTGCTSRPAGTRQRLSQLRSRDDAPHDRQGAEGPLAGDVLVPRASARHHRAAAHGRPQRAGRRGGSRAAAAGAAARHPPAPDRHPRPADSPDDPGQAALSSAEINSTAPTTRLVNGLLVPRATMRASRTQLWRLANIGSDLFYQVQLEGHRFRVIAEDGSPVWRVRSARTLVMAPGKRYDVLVEAAAPARTACARCPIQRRASSCCRRPT